MATSATCDLELSTDGQANTQSAGGGDSLINELHRRWSSDLDDDRADGTVEPIHRQPVMVISSVDKDDAMARNNEMEPDDQSRTTDYPRDRSVSDQIHYAPQFIRSSQDPSQASRSYMCAPSDRIHYAPQFIRSPQELPQAIRSPMSAPSDQIIWPPMRQAVYAPTSGGAAPQTTYAPPIHQAVYANGVASTQAPASGSFTSFGKRSYSQSQDSARWHTSIQTGEKGSMGLSGC
eukprot:gene12610-15838_t